MWAIVSHIWVLLLQLLPRDVTALRHAKLLQPVKRALECADAGLKSARGRATQAQKQVSVFGNRKHKTYTFFMMV
jgi:hypothetical protein